MGTGGGVFPLGPASPIHAKTILRAVEAVCSLVRTSRGSPTLTRHCDCNYVSSISVHRTVCGNRQHGPLALVWWGRYREKLKAASPDTTLTGADDPVKGE